MNRDGFDDDLALELLDAEVEQLEAYIKFLKMSRDDFKKGGLTVQTASEILGHAVTIRFSSLRLIGQFERF